MRRLKFRPEINTGSMADIAFLLLIFFLVTATISTDQGINRLLPKPCSPGQDCSSDVRDRNILKVMLNNKDEIMVDNELITLDELKDLAKAFLDNNGDGSCTYCNGIGDENSSEHPKKAVISLQNMKQTSYEQYIAVQNELTKAYYELRNLYTIKVLGKSSDNLTKDELEQVRKAYPFILSEAETK